MQVTVHFLGQLRRATGRAGEECAVEPGWTVADLFRRLAETGGDELRALLLDGDDRPRKPLLVFIGDEQVTADRPLQDRDEVTVLAPMAGG